METLAALLVLGFGAVILFYIVKWSLMFLREILRLGHPPASAPQPGTGVPDEGLDADGMDPGDYYNGPGGYDATGGYLDRHEER